MTSYRAPGRVVRATSALAAALVRRGLPLFGAEVLAVRGRRSGQWRTVPVNPVPLEGTIYLVAPRGTTDWVRNLRAAGTCELRRGKRVRVFSATELPDADKAAVVRAYLARWGWQVGPFFQGATAKSSDAELLRVAAEHPAFRLEGSAS